MIASRKIFAGICPSSDGVHRAPAVGLEFGHSLAVFRVRAFVAGERADALAATAFSSFGSDGGVADSGVGPTGFAEPFLR